MVELFIEKFMLFAYVVEGGREFLVQTKKGSEISHHFAIRTRLAIHTQLQEKGEIRGSHSLTGEKQFVKGAPDASRTPEIKGGNDREIERDWTKRSRK